MPNQLTPTNAERTWLSASTGKLAALDARPAATMTSTAVPGATQPTLLLVPGYTGSKEDFAPILDPLAAAGIRALALDLPGQYESPGSDAEPDYLPAPLGDVIADVVRDLARGGPVTLLGHSYGGLVARAAVLSGAPVDGLVLLCSGPGAFTGGMRFEALRFAEPIMRTFGLQAAYQLAAGAVSTGAAGGAGAMLDFYRKRFLASSKAGMLGMGRALLTEADRVDELADAVRARSLGIAVVAGERDDAWPVADQRSMAARLDTELVVIRGAGHSPATEQPMALLDVLIPLVRRWTSDGNGDGAADGFGDGSGDGTADG